jgi:formylglycine-generating enzyme required for sulfatase activity
MGRVDVQREESVALEGGEFLMGSVDRFAYPEDGEGPVRRIRLDALRVDTRAVSASEFARFVEATGHVTEAERFGWSLYSRVCSPTTFLPPEVLRQHLGGVRSRVRTGGNPRDLAQG